MSEIMRRLHIFTGQGLIKFKLLVHGMPSIVDV